MESKPFISRTKPVQDEANRTKNTHHFSVAESKPSVAKLVTVESVYAQIREKRRLKDLESVEGYCQLPRKKRRLQVDESVKNNTPVLITKKKLQTTPDLQVRVEDAKFNGLEGRKTRGLAGATTAGQRSEQHKTIESSHFKVNPSLSPTADPDVHSSTLYVIKESPGKGRGMFATTHIREGTRILAEEPFFTLAKSPEVSLTDPYAPNDISKAFDRLPTDKQLKYMQLHCPKRMDCSVLVGIYEANCYEMGTGDCFCVDASRINHSCFPNSHYSWNDNIRRLTVHAVKDIPKGEEITVSYCSGFCTLKKRRLKLKPYVFTCRCPACQEDTDFGRLSRNRRREIVNLRQEIADYQNDSRAARSKHVSCDEQSAISKVLSLIEEEGLVHEKSIAYRDAVDWALKKGYREEALKYASKELDVDSCCTGKDSPSYLETKSFLQKIYDATDE